MLTLEGRTVLVTGCGGNIGKRLVRELAEAGMKVIVCGHGPHKGEKRPEPPKDRPSPAMGKPGQAVIESLPEELRSQCIGINCVIEDPEDVGIQFAKAAEITGGIDAVVFLHGRSAEYREQNFETLDPEYVSRTLINHATSCYYGIREAIPYLEKSSAGRVILMANSEARMGGDVNAMAVSMAKGAVISLTYSAAHRLAPKGITVNCIALGGIMNVPVPPGSGRGSGKNAAPRTTFGAPNWILEEELYDVSKIPMGRLGKDEDVTCAIEFLLSEEAGYITGEVMNISGGLCMG